MHVRRWFVALVAAVALAGLVAIWRMDRGALGDAERATETDAPDEAAPASSEVPGSDEVEDASNTSPADMSLGSVGGTLPDVLVDPEVVIAKSARTLAVLSSGAQPKVYRIALGAQPVGDKEREGDLRTPEGEFYICSKNAESRYHRALGLSYPAEEDAERGLAKGLITKRQYNDIVRAIHQMKRPPHNTPLGGEIMIHGGGTHADWTEGCIALTDEDAEQLFDALPLGTPVRIER